MNTPDDERQASAGQVERPVRPHATSVTWRNAEGGSWQQWHDDGDPMPTEWDDRPPDEVLHVYTAAQVREMLEGAWCAGYYDAGYTHDSAYACKMAEKCADEFLGHNVQISGERSESDES